MTDQNSISKLDERMKSVEKKLENLTKIVVELKNSMNQVLSEKTTKNPLIASKSLTDSLRIIKRYEHEHHYGIRAAELAKIRDLALPSIYEQLNKLEEADLVIWQRGKDIGLKPANAKFFSLKERGDSLWEIDVIMQLPEKVAQVAKIIRDAAKTGISYDELLKKYNDTLSSKQDKKSVKKVVDQALETLLQRVLIKKETSLDKEKYYVYESAA